MSRAQDAAPPVPGLTTVAAVAHLATLPRALRHVAREHPGAVGLAFEGRETSYAAFEHCVRQVAQALAASGVRSGDRIAYVGKNSDHYFELLFGAASMGAVMAPISWRLAAPEMALIAGHSEAVMLFVGPESASAVRAFLPGLAQVRHVVAIEGGEAPWQAYALWRDAAPVTAPSHESAPGDVVLQLYTSGTTGRPKGAMLSHRNLTTSTLVSEHAGLEWTRWTADDVSLLAMPVAHIAGTGWGLRGLLVGARNIVVREFDPRTVLDFIERDRISKLFMVPAALQIMLRDRRARDVDYSRLRYLVYGSAPIPAALLREGLEVIGCGFVQQYGMTETCGTVVGLPPEDHSLQPDAPRMRAAGKAMPWARVEVVDSAGSRLAPGQVGELVVQSPQNMVGYWRQPEETARTVDAQGWLRTGDAGCIDADGYIYIQDRVKDMIISGGENVYPAEIESVLYGHPDVADVAVIGVPDDKWGEAVKGVVVLRPGAEPDVAAILAWVRERLAGFKTPKSLDFVAELPRNPSGKVLRRALREPYWKGRERQVN